MIYDCIIAGAGASGLFAGASFEPVGASRRLTGLILEKTDRPGTKLLMSGGGQCNITHAGSIKDFIDRYGKKGGRIRSCLYRHNNLELIRFLQKHGIHTVTQEDGRVFPASGKAREILDLLLQTGKENGFEIACHQEITGIHRIPEDCWELTTDQTTFRARTVILATGGCSYPGTGSDGSLFPVLKRDLDLAITPLQPALTPIRVRNYPYASLSGISFPDCRVTLLRAQKKIAEEHGGLLFTHKDLSGPAILNCSNHAKPGDTLVISYLDLSRNEAAASLQKAVETSRGELSSILADTFHLPRRFCQLLTARIGTSTKALAAALTGEAFLITSLSGFEKAMVTAGGIDLSQIDLKTMALKNHPGLFVCGELMDINGSTGGYNLQFAWSSARTAAEAAAAFL